MSGLFIIWGSVVELSSIQVVFLWADWRVSCRGKGDYHRLGHGTDDHVRRPRRVTALQGKKIVSIACGSLHCVAVSDSGTVVTAVDKY